MKTILTLVTTAVLAMSTACSAEPGKDAVKPTVAKPTEAPKVVEAPKPAETPKTKQVCLDVMQNGKPVKDAKGNVKQNCRTVKVHKKHEGTKIEGATKSK